MQVSSTPLAYVDTNVFVSYALGEEREESFHIAEKFFEGISEGDYIVLVSSFVLIETLHTLRNIATEQLFKEIEKKTSQSDLIKIANSEKFRKGVNDRSLEAFRAIIDCITSDPEHFRFGDLKTIYSEEMFSKALRILTANLGEFRVYHFRCQKCGSNVDCTQCGFDSEIVYKSFNAPDLTHLLMSSSLGCKYLFTLDKRFAKIPKSPSQSEIILLSKKI
jgi:predicted nucleic acid-binding protein